MVLPSWRLPLIKGVSSPSLDRWQQLHVTRWQQGKSLFLTFFVSITKRMAFRSPWLESPIPCKHHNNHSMAATQNGTLSIIYLFIYLLILWKMLSWHGHTCCDAIIASLLLLLISVLLSRRWIYRLCNCVPSKIKYWNGAYKEGNSTEVQKYS